MLKINPIKNNICLNTNNQIKKENKTVNSNQGTINQVFYNNQYYLPISFNGSSGKNTDKITEGLMDFLYSDSLSEEALKNVSKPESYYRNEFNSKEEGPKVWFEQDIKTLMNTEKVNSDWVKEAPKLANLIFFIATGETDKDVCKLFGSNQQVANVLNSVISNKQNFAEKIKETDKISVAEFYENDSKTYRKLRSAVYSNDYKAQIELNKQMALIAKKRGNLNSVCNYYEKALVALQSQEASKESSVKEEYSINKILAGAYEKNADTSASPDEKRALLENSVKHNKNMLICLSRQNQMKSVESAQIKENLGRLSIKQADISEPDKKNNFLNSAKKCYESAIDTLKECSPENMQKIAELKAQLEKLA